MLSREASADAATPAAGCPAGGRSGAVPLKCKANECKQRNNVRKAHSSGSCKLVKAGAVSLAELSVVFQVVDYGKAALECRTVVHKIMGLDENLWRN